MRIQTRMPRLTTAASLPTNLPTLPLRVLVHARAYTHTTTTTTTTTPALYRAWSAPCTFSVTASTQVCTAPPSSSLAGSRKTPTPPSLRPKATTPPQPQRMQPAGMKHDHVICTHNASVPVCVHTHTTRISLRVHGEVAHRVAAYCARACVPTMRWMDRGVCAVFNSFLTFYSDCVRCVCLSLCIYRSLYFFMCSKQ